MIIESHLIQFLEKNNIIGYSGWRLKIIYHTVSHLGNWKKKERLNQKDYEMSCASNTELSKDAVGF